MTEPTSAQMKAFDFAQELVKQILTVSAGIITITITFIKDFAGAGTPTGAKTLLACSWVFYLLAVVLGFAALGALTGALGSGVNDVNAKTVRNPAVLQLGSFLLGLTLTVAAGIWAL